MARTRVYYQAANAAYGIAAGSGSGATHGDPAAFSVAAYIASLNSGADVFLNRGGLVVPASATAVVDWNLVTAAPGNLGRVFMWDGQANSGLGRDPMTFDAGRYDPPSLSGDAGGWVNIGDGRWTKNFSWAADPDLRAIYAQAQAGVGLDVVRLELCKRSSQANCVDIGDWHVSGTTTQTVTICTGSDAAVDGSPARVFSGLALVGTAARWAGALWFNDAKRLEFLEPVIVMHGGIRARAGSGTGICSDILMIEPQSRYYVRNNLLIDPAAATTATAGTYRIRLVRPKLRSDTRPEASQKDYASITNGLSTQHSLRVYGQSGEISIVDPELQGGRHALIEVQGDTALTYLADANWPRNVEVYGTRPGSARAIMPGDELGYYRFAAVATNGGCRVENFVVSGQNTRSQLSGRCRFVRNLMHEFIAPNLSRASPDNNGGADLALNVAINGSGSQKVVPLDVVIERNVIVNPWNYPLRVGFTFDDLFPAGALKFRFNTVIDLAHFHERKTLDQSTNGKVWGSLTAGASGSIKITSNSGPEGVYVTTQVFENNCWITPNSSILVDGTRSGSFGNGPGATVDGATVNGSFFNAYAASGNQHAVSLAAAGLGDDYAPQDGSALLGAATDRTPRLDYSAKLCPIPQSVGAMERH